MSTPKTNNNSNYNDFHDKNNTAREYTLHCDVWSYVAAIHAPHPGAVLTASGVMSGELACLVRI